MMFLRARSLAMGCSGARPVLAETMLAMLERRHHAGRPRARLARRERRPRAARPLRAGADRRGRGLDSPDERRAARRRGRSPRPASSRVVLGPKEGLALINGTDGILGMLVLALADLGVLLRARRRRGGDDDVEALLGTDRAFAADLRRAAPAARPGASSAANLPPARRLADRRQPPRERPARAGRLLAALQRRRSTAPRATPCAHVEASPRTSSPRRSTTRWSCPTGASSRAATSTARRWRSPATSSRSPPPRSARSPSGAPTGCSTRRARRACRRSSPPSRRRTPG